MIAEEARAARPATLLTRARDRSLPLPHRLAAVAELAARSGHFETLLALAHADEAVRPEVFLALGGQGAEAARRPLLGLLRTTRDPDTAARAAEILEAVYDDDTGLRMFQGDLGTIDEDGFRRAWELYQAVVPPRRGLEYLGRVGRALERQVQPAHLAALLHLLSGVAPGRELGERVVPWLVDRRRTRAPLLHRRGCLGDFAAECLLAALGVPPPSGPLARWRWRRLRRRLRSRVRTVEDWDALRAEGEEDLTRPRRERPSPQLSRRKEHERP